MCPQVSDSVIRDNTASLYQSYKSRGHNQCLTNLSKFSEAIKHTCTQDPVQCQQHAIAPFVTLQAVYVAKYVQHYGNTEQW